MMGILALRNESTVPTPATNHVYLYTKADGKVYKKTPEGVESEIGAGGGTTVALVANFSILDGELSVSHLSSMTPSLVDGEFIVELETI
jgi:hypothetical protein